MNLRSFADIIIEGNETFGRTLDIVIGKSIN